jgi:LmbE family N-acetylglucosaminyl deacetylase
VLGAHPDDEIVGAGGLLLRSRGCSVIYVTDGAPADPRHRGPGFADRAAYARLRQQEARRALALADIGPSHIFSLSGTDQRAAFDAARLAVALVNLLESLRPPALVIHAYEGGHPDHDAAAFVGRAAFQLLEQPPALYEMTSYHARGPGLAVGEFLPSAMTITLLKLDGAERELKHRMIECHQSQRETLAGFGVKDEPFRPAPPADFSRPPHAGELYHERMGWMSGADLRALLAAAALELSSEPWLVSTPWVP